MKLADEEIIFQDPTGLILLAPKGEKITGHYGFYSAFMSDDEFRIVHDGADAGAMHLPKRHGALFDPDRYPFLEGRAAGTAWRSTVAEPLAVSGLAHR